MARRTEADGDDSSGRAHSETPTLRGMLDVLVYAPLGFALSAGTLVPELAAKGRARAQEQLRLARMIGQLAVPVVRRKGERLVREQVDRATRSATRIKPANTAPQETAVAPKVVRHSPQQMPKRASTRTTPTTGPGAGRTRRTGPERAVADLPIDGYDELPASSIITLLDGLRPAQLRSIDAHERANRGRRTILTRIGQLLT